MYGRNNNKGRNNQRGRNTMSLRNNTGRPRNQLPIDPPQMSQMRVIRQTMRYTATGSTLSAVITGQCLLNAKVALYSDGTTVQSASILTCVRIRKVNIWATTADGANSVSFTWLGDNALQNTVVDSGSTTRPAKLTRRPPPRSSAGWWLTTTTSNLNDPIFQMVTPTNSTVDVHLEYVIQDWLGKPYGGIVPTTAPATGMYVYTPPLDNCDTAGAAGPGSYTPLFMDGALLD